MVYKISEQEREKRRKRFIKSLFLTKESKYGGRIMKKPIYKKMLINLRKYNQDQKELRAKVEKEIQAYLTKVILPKYGIKKDWHIKLNTRCWR